MDEKIDQLFNARWQGRSYNFFFVKIVGLFWNFFFKTPSSGVARNFLGRRFEKFCMGKFGI